MGRGTTAVKSVPKKRKLYGDDEFHLRPIYLDRDKNGTDHYGFLLRPVTDKELLVEGYLFLIEGEFGVGKSSYDIERLEVRRATYKHTGYYYYGFDLEDCTPRQERAIKRWATDGEI